MSRPGLDVTDVLTDPDFCDSGLLCARLTSSTDDQGLGETTQQNFSFSGVVCSADGFNLMRGADAEHAEGSISIVTRFPLRASGVGVTADIVTWNCKQYTVVKVNDYSRYGPGFIEAILDLLPLAG